MDAETELEQSKPVAPRKKRYQLLTVFLWWLVAGNAISAVLSPFALANIRRPSIPDFPDCVAWPFSLFSALNLVFLAALFRWKRWGIFGYAISTAAIYALNVYAGVGAGAAALGFVATVILFVGLQIGRAKSCWSQMD